MKTSAFLPSGTSAVIVRPQSAHLKENFLIIMAKNYSPIPHAFGLCFGMQALVTRLDSSSASQSSNVLSPLEPKRASCRAPLSRDGKERQHVRRSLAEAQKKRWAVQKKASVKKAAKGSTKAAKKASVWKTAAKKVPAKKVAVKAAKPAESSTPEQKPQ